MMDRSFEPMARKASAWVALVMLGAAGLSLAMRSTWLLSLAGPAVLGVLLVQLGDYGRRGSWLPNAFTFSRVLVTAWLSRIGAQLTGPSLSTAIMLVLVMDGLDGLVARSTNTSSAQGAQLDVESDAFVLMTVCVIHVLRGLSPWVLVAGLLRYAYVISIELFEVNAPALRCRYGRAMGGLALCGLTLAFTPGALSTLLIVSSTLLLVGLFGRALYTSVRGMGSSARAINATS